MAKIRTFLMFEGQAEEAINFYVSVFKNSKINSIKRFGKKGPGPENSIFQAEFELNGQCFLVTDSAEKHDYTFTPSISMFVNCESKDELKEIYTKLGEGGKVLMPVENYGFSKRFGWISDKFGVSWQLNLPG